MKLENFRNHEYLEFTFPKGATTIIGSNGRGKTNIVEAIHYLSCLNSHRVSSDEPLIRNGNTTAQIFADVEKHNRQAKVQLTINYPGVNKAILNQNPLTKPKDILGLVSTVIFSPEDLELVKGEPAGRRRFIDELNTSLTPKFINARSDYEKILKQRNTLLKSLGRRMPSMQASATLEAWTEQLVNTGSEIIRSRCETLDRLVPHTSRFGQDISGNTEHLGLEYSNTWLPSDIRNEHEIGKLFKLQLENKFKEEIERGTTLIGPHRDDLYIELSGMPARGYASHGQSWSIAIALRLGSFQMLREHDDDPILILDDVFAELDELRRNRLISAISDAEQTLITAAVKEDVPKALPSHQLLLEDD